MHLLPAFDMSLPIFVKTLPMTRRQGLTALRGLGQSSWDHAPSRTRNAITRSAQLRGNTITCTSAATLFFLRGDQRDPASVNHQIWSVRVQSTSTWVFHDGDDGFGGQFGKTKSSPSNLEGWGCSSQLSADSCHDEPLCYSSNNSKCVFNLARRISYEKPLKLIPII
jgi:hypothetical protein